MDAHFTMVEIYGSTETGGLGFRTQGDVPFSLMPHLKRVGAGIVRRGDPNVNLDVQDNLHWTARDRFRLHGRRDAMIQIGGHNVLPDAVARKIAALPNVREAAVRPDGNRLKAFVVPATAGSFQEADKANLRQSIYNVLSVPERPQSITFGPSLPKNQLGKPADWAENPDPDLPKAM